MPAAAAVGGKRAAPELGPLSLPCHVPAGAPRSQSSEVGPGFLG